MKLNSSTYTLKTGEEIEIREASVSDAPKLLETVKTYVGESYYIPYAEGEFNLSLEDEQKWIKSFIDQDNSVLIIAIHDDEIIGNITVNGVQRQMMKHNAVIGIGLLEEWTNKGIGTLLFEEAIKWSKANPILEYLSLETYSSNKRGIAVYKKFGFEEIGVTTNFVKISPNKYEDNLIMRLDLK